MKSFSWSVSGLNSNFPLLAVGALIVLAPSSQATMIGLTPTPNGATVLATSTDDAPGTLVVDMLVPYSFTTTVGTTSGTVESAVYRESGGTLDFYYQVSNSADSVTAIARETNTNFGFAAFTSDTGFRTDGSTLTGTTFVNGTFAPVFCDRGLSGTVNGFLFDLDESTKIAPGTASNVFIISTNATMWGLGNASVIDGGAQTVASYQPASANPEPGSMLLLGGGLLTLVGLRRFRRLNQEAILRSRRV